LSLAYYWLPQVGAWFALDSTLSRLIATKLALLALTVALALHARLRVIPRLGADNFTVLAYHVFAVTLLSLAFLVAGVGIRTGGLVCRDLPRLDGAIGNRRVTKRREQAEHVYAFDLAADRLLAWRDPPASPSQTTHVPSQALRGNPRRRSARPASPLSVRDTGDADRERPQRQPSSVRNRCAARAVRNIARPCRARQPGVAGF